eukprot:953243_1
MAKLSIGDYAAIRGIELRDAVKTGITGDIIKQKRRARDKKKIAELDRLNKELNTKIHEEQKKGRYESGVAELKRLNKELTTQINNKQTKHMQMTATQKLEIEKLKQSNKELDTQIKEKQKENGEQKREYESKVLELTRLSE